MVSSQWSVAVLPEMYDRIIIRFRKQRHGPLPSGEAREPAAGPLSIPDTDRAELHSLRCRRTQGRGAKLRNSPHTTRISKNLLAVTDLLTIIY